MKEGTLNFAKEVVIGSEYAADQEVIFHLGDATTFTRTLPDAAVDLVITSPPYNVGKAYETKTSIAKYLESQTELIEELIRVLKPTGSICWQVGNYVDKGEIFPLDIFFYDIFKSRGLQLRNRVVWHFGHGLHAKKRLSGRYETLLWFTKSSSYKFNLDPIRVPSKYPGKRHYKGPKKGQLSGNPLGKNPSDFWVFLANEWETGVWEIPNCKSNHPEKTIHPCQFPVELVERCVLGFTDEGDTVFDPYAGVGSSVLGAIKNHRKGIGVDKDPAYHKVALQRIYDFYNGLLKVRPMGKPIHKPTGREKIARTPEEWKNK
ncbi:MAG: site-specific DNA-methyltransferase [Bacteroidetes bacterium]|nr:MAG: site-specific DNA-methyltransferase [Bacteroidota bacterium]